MAELYLNAKNAIAGRLASYSAKQAMLGHTVKIFNCEEAVITGRKPDIFAKQKERQERGTPFKGPYIQKLSDKFLRRMIRGMLPYKQAKGKDAFQRIMCYLGVPSEFNDKQLQTIKICDVLESNARTFLTIHRVCKFLGGRQ